MSLIKGIYAASMSVLNDDLTLNIRKTIEHAEMLINRGCHGVAVFGSTGQAQLISVSEKIDLINNMTTSKFKEKYIIGTGLNSLGETINLMRVAKSLNFKNFLIMPPAFYKYEDDEVIKFYSKIVEAIPECEIVLYNFEKLCGYKFSIECVQELVKRFPKQIIGVKDSSYNLFENLKLDNFSVLPGSESKLLKGLQLGCSGIITATCNVTSELARKVYDDFLAGNEQTVNQKLCDVRNTFEKYNLISGLHTYYSKKNQFYKNVLPPLKTLNSRDEKELIDNLANLNFSIKSSMTA
ncbi:dihydrodipicolinate synthase family protein [Candidatus Pelagibacter sp.]|jgi:4-hydroxy-tetrahydrodipicolinate synthase|nr:dihydrodipicolinate synthase family protein [Candidatus Pelagibacter sp.]